MKKIILGGLVLVLTSSCVTKKMYVDLEDKYNQLLNEKKELLQKNDDLVTKKNDYADYLSEVENKYSKLKNQKNAMQREADALRKSYEDLKKTYDLLASKSSSALEANANQNRYLLAQLEEKESQLMEEGARLRKLENELGVRSERIDNLEKLIAEKEAAMKRLKGAVSNALKGFEGKGLSVVNKNGNVYVSMENKLLFASGSWAVGKNGTTAVVELAKVLANNRDIKVLIEGHTDDVPYSGNTIQDNWDLSVKRATAIVRILQKHKVNANQITAAGRGEHVPVASNATPEGKAKNRRIEIILSPNLDEVAKLLNE